MNGKEVWFSQREKKWVVTGGWFSWTDEIDVWDWDGCTVCVTKSTKDELLAVVWSKTNKNSSYMGDKPVELRFMLGVPHQHSPPARGRDVYSSKEHYRKNGRSEGKVGVPDK